MTIKDVSEQYNLSKDTLRYYEKEGLIGQVLKGSNGQRKLSRRKSSSNRVY